VEVEEVQEQVAVVELVVIENQNFCKPSNSRIIPVSVQGYPITVGGGGAAGTQVQVTHVLVGQVIFNIFYNYFNGGGGGGGSNCSNTGILVVLVVVVMEIVLCGGTGGAGNTPPVAPPQGNSGGNGTVSVDLLELEVVEQVVQPSFNVVLQPMVEMVVMDQQFQLIRNTNYKSWRRWRWYNLWKAVGTGGTGGGGAGGPGAGVPGVIGTVNTGGGGGGGLVVVLLEPTV
jgi:hypothetical protein